jgi:hypothetical protein
VQKPYDKLLPSTYAQTILITFFANNCNLLSILKVKLVSKLHKATAELISVRVLSCLVFSKVEEMAHQTV